MSFIETDKRHPIMLRKMIQIKSDQIVYRYRVYHLAVAPGLPSSSLMINIHLLANCTIVDSNEPNQSCYSVHDSAA